MYKHKSQATSSFLKETKVGKIGLCVPPYRPW